MGFPDGIGFVANPTAFNKELLPAAREAGLEGFAVRTQHGSTLVNGWDEVVAFRDWARGQGVYVAAWIDLEVTQTYDGIFAAELATDVSRNFDGDVVDAEWLSFQRSGPFLAAFTPHGRFALSTTVTFEVGPLAAAWDRRGAYLLQQAYAIELPGGQPRTVRDAWWWAVEAPPVWVGWYYRATVNGRGRRVLVSSGYGEGWKVDAFDGRYLLDKRRRLHRVGPRSGWGEIVGHLSGVWNPERVRPTMRTTPMPDGTQLTAVVAAADVRATPTRPRVGFFEAENTPALFWANYRP